MGAVEHLNEKIVTHMTPQAFEAKPAKNSVSVTCLN
jgi:hypothetical protein